MGNNNSAHSKAGNKSIPPPSTQKRTTDNQLTTASKTGILNLSNKNLEKLPKGVENLRIPKNFFPFLTNLRQINLSKNKLSSDAVSILALLPNLQKIDLSHNHLTNFNFVCSHSLTKLKSLDLSYNNISELPKNEITKSITKVDLSHNKLASLDTSLQLFDHVQNLNISFNQISKLPNNFSSSGLIEINLNNNQLLSLNAKNLIRIGTLKVLRLNNNRLKLVEFSEDFMKESKVSTLEYDGNDFENKYFKELPGYDEFEKRVAKLIMKKE